MSDKNSESCPILKYRNSNKRPLSKVVHYKPETIEVDWYGRGSIYCGKTGHARTSRFTGCWSKVTCKKCIKHVLQNNWDKIKPILLEMRY